MIKSNRRLSKASGYCCLPSLQHNYPSVIKGCFVFSMTIAFYLNYRFAYSILSDTVYTNGNVLSRSDIEFQSLSPFPNDSLTSQSTIQEWEQQTNTPMIGFYRYSSIATIQLPTADLEEPRPKQTQDKGGYPDDSLSNNNDIVVLTRKGHKFNPEDRKRTPNQDRVLVLSRRDDTIHGKNNGSSDWWMGLFDGHGNYGHAVSQFVSSEFARRINKEWEDENSSRSSKAASSNTKSSTAVKDMLRVTCREINHSIPSFMRSAGSTGISVLKRGDSLYISNIGDSVVFVASYDNNKTHNSQSGLKIIYSAKPHKPDTPSERKRIEEMGGRVQDPQFKGASARLIIPVEVGLQTMEVGLAMSRSFGDHDGIKVGLSVEPDTDVLDLSKFDNNKNYIVVAVTDGLVDFGRLSEEEVALAMAKAFSTADNQTNRHHHLVSAQGTEAASKLIMKSSKMWDSDFGDYRDDISIVAHKLRL